jgi:hypothetical protein
MRKGQLLLTLLGGVALGGAMPAYEAEAALKREPVGSQLAQQALQDLHDGLQMAKNEREDGAKTSNSYRTQTGGLSKKEVEARLEETFRSVEGYLAEGNVLEADLKYDSYIKDYHMYQEIGAIRQGYEKKDWPGDTPPDYGFNPNEATVAAEPY